MSDPQTTAWLQLGAVGVLALINIVELRALRPWVKSVSVILAALLERERIRAERKREPSGPVPSMSDGVPNADADERDTDLISIMERQRKRAPRTGVTPPAGVRSPRPGTHHD